MIKKSLNSGGKIDLKSFSIYFCTLIHKLIKNHKFFNRKLREQIFHIKINKINELHIKLISFFLNEIKRFTPKSF